jgi:hypothetical protein
MSCCAHAFDGIERSGEFFGAIHLAFRGDGFKAGGQVDGVPKDSLPRQEAEEVTLGDRPHTTPKDLHR